MFCLYPRAGHRCAQARRGSLHCLPLLLGPGARACRKKGRSGAACRNSVAPCRRRETPWYAAGFRLEESHRRVRWGDDLKREKARIYADLRLASGIERLELDQVELLRAPEHNAVDLHRGRPSAMWSPRSASWMSTSSMSRSSLSRSVIWRLFFQFGA